MARQSARRRAKRFLLNLVPTPLLRAQLHRRTIMQFADRIGLVYFGHVNQHRDEHGLVRGLTLSPTHIDHNYCVGTYQGYDVSLLERSDTIKQPGKAPKPYEWLIMTFDLHARVDLPHVFIGLHTGDETFYRQLFTKFSKFSAVPLGRLNEHSKDFLSRRTVFAPTEQALSAERLLGPPITKSIAEQFGSLMVEIHDGTLYLYGEQYRPNMHQLDRMLQLGTWLAETLDAGAARG